MKMKWFAGFLAMVPLLHSWFQCYEIKNHDQPDDHSHVRAQANIWRTEIPTLRFRREGVIAANAFLVKDGWLWRHVGRHFPRFYICAFVSR
jgi:hypothetical protein